MGIKPSGKFGKADRAQPCHQETLGFTQCVFHRRVHDLLDRTVVLTPDSRVLDVAAGTGALALLAARTGAVAAGTGALALLAARTGAWVLATDFSPAMVARIAAANLTNVEARLWMVRRWRSTMAADAVFSIFGVIMFPDRRKGLSEMARVTRPGGYRVVATWQDRGAATFLLLGQIRRKLFPERAGMTMPMAVQALSDPADFARELVTAGFRDPHIQHVTHEYLLETAALAEPDTLFGMSSDWTSLSEAEKAAVFAEVWTFAADRAILPIPSVALIATARR